LRDPDLSAGIRISTLDSFAWNLRAGFHDGEIGFSSYDENIQKAGQLIALDGNAKDYLKTISHFIVDEAQDITGDRSSLVQEVIENLSSQCGVSIFSDEAQAIYGFSEEE
jgi:superfamily I DNA/RNA helicase